MATQIGIVKTLTGEVTATAADGSIRTLQVGDRVYANELISTGQAGALEIEFSDGSIMDLGRNSQAMLDSAGLSLFVNPRVTAGAGYVLEKGGVGTVGFEEPLTVQAWEEKGTRSWVVQGFAVPAFAVERPYAMKKITGLAG